MDFVRATTVGAVTVILATTLLSGGVVDLTADRPTFSGAGEGDAAVSVVSVPTDVALERGSAEADVYHLRAAPAHVTASAIDGRPILVYELAIPELQFWSVRKYILTEPGDQRLRFTAGTLDGDRIANDSYRATVTIKLDGDRERVVYRRNVTVGVQQ
jgi:hypothetical protein